MSASRGRGVLQGREQGCPRPGGWGRITGRVAAREESSRPGGPDAHPALGRALKLERLKEWVRLKEPQGHQSIRRSPGWGRKRGPRQVGRSEGSGWSYGGMGRRRSLVGQGDPCTGFPLSPGFPLPSKFLLASPDLGWVFPDSEVATLPECSDYHQEKRHYQAQFNCQLQRRQTRTANQKARVRLELRNVANQRVSVLARGSTAAGRGFGRKLAHPPIRAEDVSRSTANSRGRG